MLTMFLLVSMLLPIVSYAASTAEFSYNSATGKLSGRVYVQDPSKVKVNVKNSVYESTYVPLKEISSNYVTYDERNEPIKLGRFEMNIGPNDAPIQLTMNVCGQEVPIIQWGGYDTTKLYYSYDSWRQGPYRTTGHQYYTMHPLSGYIMPGDKIVDFVAPDNSSDAISIDMPYRSGASSIVKAVYASDFTLWDDTVSQAVDVKKAEQGWGDFEIQADAPLIAGHQYTLRLSSTADGDEIQLPGQQGLYSARTSIGNYEPGTNYVTAKSRVYFDNLELGVITTGGTPGSQGNGAPFADMSSCSGADTGTGTDTGGGSNPGNGTDTGNGTETSTGAGNDPSGGVASPSAGGNPQTGNTEPKETNEGVRLGSGSLTVTESAGADGKTTATVAFNADKLAQALNLLKGKDEDKQVVIVDLSGMKAATANVEIPAGVLASTANQAPHVVLAIQGPNAGYLLPVGVLNLTSAAQKLGVSPDDVKVVVSLVQESGAAAEPVANKAAQAGMTLASDPYEFSVSLVVNGKSTPVNDFGSTLVTRTIKLAGTWDVELLVGVRYDAETQTFYPVPTVFTQVDGQIEAVMQRNGNSTYAVVTHQQTFEDLNQHWSKADVEWLASKMIAQGMTETTFSPDASITRAQFASLVVRALGLAEDQAAAANFSDVTAKDWYAGAVGAAVKTGLVSGFEDRTFLPNAIITREQMAVMAARALAFAGQEAGANASAGKLAKYADAGAVSGWAEAAFSQMIQTGIMQGTGDAELTPEGTATRAQAAVVVKRLLQTAGLMNK
ncbi:S-layer homology domain-containing protein [Paenibacillus sp. HJGM_3]